MNDDQALRYFVAQYARPYDPETDDYDRPPFAADIKEGKTIRSITRTLTTQRSHHAASSPTSFITPSQAISSSTRFVARV